METIDVKYEKKELEELISSEDLIKEYKKIYSQIKQKYINYFKKGTGKKTNDYYQPSIIIQSMTTLKKRPMNLSKDGTVAIDQKVSLLNTHITYLYGVQFVMKYLDYMIINLK